MPKITYAELMKELDKYRKGVPIFTPEQDKFIKECRNKDKGTVPYPVMVELWSKLGWGKIAEKSLLYRYKQIR